MIERHVVNHQSRQPLILPSKCVQNAIHLVESVRASGGEDLLATLRWCAVGQRELEVLGGELLDVGSPDVVGLLNLDDLEDLFGQELVSCMFADLGMVSHTWMVLKRARWREAMSW